MTFQYLISILNCKDINLLIKDENINADAIIVNQCDRNNTYEIKKDNFVIKVIETTERGLSKSRNLAIKNSTADICLICDDDEIFLENTKDIIIKTFEENPNIDIVKFKLEGIEDHFRDYPLEPYNVNLINFGQIISFEIALKRKSILENHICFDEDFGAGSGKYISGEENIFIADCLKKGLIIKFIPQLIAKLHINNNSTWFKGHNKEFFETKGAFFERVFHNKSKVYSLLFLIKPHRENLFTELSFLNAYKSMLLGIKKYRQENRNSNK